MQPWPQKKEARCDFLKTETAEAFAYANETTIQDLMEQNPTTSTADADGTVWYDLPGKTELIGPPLGILTPGPDQPVLNTAPAAASIGGFPPGYSYWVSCTAQTGHLHSSGGAGGALAKTRITCKGYGKSSVPVKLGAMMSFRSASGPYAVPGKAVTRAQAPYTQTIQVNGAPMTYYMPRTGNGGRGTGFWNTTSVLQIYPSGNPASRTITIWKTI